MRGVCFFDCYFGYFCAAALLTNTVIRDFFRDAVFFLSTFSFAALSIALYSRGRRAFASVNFFPWIRKRTSFAIVFTLVSARTFATLRRLVCRNAFFADAVIGIDKNYSEKSDVSVKEIREKCKSFHKKSTPRCFEGCKNLGKGWFNIMSGVSRCSEELRRDSGGYFQRAVVEQGDEGVSVLEEGESLL